MINLNIKTDKDAFNYVKSSLIEQNAKSMNDAGECQYRGFAEKTISELEDQASVHCENPEKDSDSYFDLFREYVCNTAFDAKCAIGYLIADEYYKSEFDEYNATPMDIDLQTSLVQSNPNWTINEKSVNMLKVLQRIHDGSIVEEWEKYFNLIENDFDTDDSYIGAISINLFY